MRSLGTKFRTETLCATPPAWPPARARLSSPIDTGRPTTGSSRTRSRLLQAGLTAAIEPLPAGCAASVPLWSGNSLISATSGPACGTGGGLPQCSMLVTNPNLKNPRSAQWNLDLQRAITNTITLDVAYVGVHGWNEIHSIDLNEPALGSGWDSLGATFRAGCLRDTRPLQS